MKNTTCNNSSRSVWQLLIVLLAVLAALVAALGQRPAADGTAAPAVP